MFGLCRKRKDKTGSLERADDTPSPAHQTAQEDTTGEENKR